MGLPVETIMPSRAVNVSGATLTGTQPLRSLPLNRGRKPSSARARPPSATTPVIPRPARINDRRFIIVGILEVVEGSRARAGAKEEPAVRPRQDRPMGRGRPESVAVERT